MERRWVAQAFRRPHMAARAQWRPGRPARKGAFTPVLRSAWSKAQEIIHRCIFQAVSVPFHSAAFALVGIKWWIGETCENIVIAHWPDVSWNIFPKLFFNWKKKTQQTAGSKVSTVLPTVASDRGRIAFSPQANRSRVRTETASSRRSPARSFATLGCDRRIHTCPDEPHQGRKQTPAPSNPAKWSRCESPLSPFLHQSDVPFPARCFGVQTQLLLHVLSRQTHFTPRHTLSNPPYRLHTRLLYCQFSLLLLCPFKA